MPKKKVDNDLNFLSPKDCTVNWMTSVIWKSQFHSKFVYPESCFKFCVFNLGMQYANMCICLLIYYDKERHD